MGVGHLSKDAVLSQIRKNEVFYNRVPWWRNLCRSTHSQTLFLLMTQGDSERSSLLA